MRLALLFLLSVTFVVGAVPVTVSQATARNGMVVAAHPQAVEAGVAVLKAGGNAIDAAIATSLAVGVSEPYGSGLGGKLMLLYYDAKSGKTFAVDGMDTAGSLDVAAYLQRPEDDRTYGYGAVCVPGLGAGLWAAHQKWGHNKWADNVAPAIALARNGFRILPKTYEFFAEQEKKLRRGDAEIARLYLPNGELPPVGSLLANEDLARTMEAFAREGRDGFYRGPIAEKIVSAARQGGGVITLDDLAHYQARIVEPVSIQFRGYTLYSGPPPTSGAALFLPILKALETESFTGPLRSADNLDKVGRLWRVVLPLISRTVADVPESRAALEKLLSSASIADIRKRAFADVVPAPLKKVGALPRGLVSPQESVAAGEAWLDGSFSENAMASTTHFIVADRHGNIVCATQSQSLHFGAGVVPPGTGVVLNNSMSNFTFTEPTAINYIARGKRSRSTIAPTIVLRGGKPAFALGIPGASRIPTAMLQVLLERLAFNRALAESIGDTRIHFYSPLRGDSGDALEAEQSFPHAVAEELQARGWRVNLPEPAGAGHYFGGINAIEFNANGTLTGIADPRRTNAVGGY